MSTVFFADGKPVPEVLTEQQALKYLQIESSETLKNLRDAYGLRSVCIGNRIEGIENSNRRYRRCWLDDLLENKKKKKKAK